MCDALKFLQIAISLTYFLFITCILNYITNISDEYFYNVQKLCTCFLFFVSIITKLLITESYIVSILVLTLNIIILYILN